MKRISKTLALILALVMIFTLAACGSDDTTPADTSKPAESGDPIVYRLSPITAIDDPITIAANDFAENVKAKTEGRVTVEVYPASQLGDATAVFDEIMRGTIDMAYAPPADNYEPDIYLSFLPYLATSYEDLPAVYGKDGYLFRETSKLYEKLNIKFLGYGCVGFLGIGASKAILDANKEIIPGSLIRTSADLLSKLTIEGMGYNVSTMPYVDVFSALQTGIIDGWLGGNPSINYFSFRDVIDYFYNYKVMMENYHFYVNQDSFNKMSAEDQAIFEACADEVFEKSYTDAQALDEQYLKELADFGIEVVEFTDEEMAEIAENVRKNVWPKIAADKYSEDFIEELKDSLK